MSGSDAHSAAARRARFIRAGIQIPTFVLRFFTRGRPVLLRRGGRIGRRPSPGEDTALSIPGASTELESG